MSARWPATVSNGDSQATSPLTEVEEHAAARVNGSSVCRVRECRCVGVRASAEVRHLSVAGLGCWLRRRATAGSGGATTPTTRPSDGKRASEWPMACQRVPGRCLVGRSRRPERRAHGTQAAAGECERERESDTARGPPADTHQGDTRPVCRLIVHACMRPTNPSV